MADLNTAPIPPSLDPGEQELAEELSLLQKRDSWVGRYSVFVSLLLVVAIVTLSVVALRQGAEPFYKVRLTEAIFGLIALIVLFNVYTIRQEILIKQLRSQLTEKQSQFYNLRNLSMIDPLTGLYNRRFAEQRLAAEVSRSERMGHPLALVMLDLNHFKQLNEASTRETGDQALKAFATRLSRVIRGSDLAVRLDADKFMILLPECADDQLQRVLGRLSPFELDWNGQKVPVTFTAAWKQYELGESPEEFLARVDQGLAGAKKVGSKAPYFETLTL
ncbi:MAG: GGDEF domain-containing protein [Candidatus Acidiferrum sp.]|jgi:diguanylate cyclase (GGDEF)-like protein